MKTRVQKQMVLGGSALDKGRITEKPRDITDRKKTETALQEKVEDLRRMATVVSDSNDAVIMHDLEGKILAWNRGAKETYGYSEAEALGKNVREIVAEPDREAALTLIQKIKQGEVFKSFELRRVTKDGRILDVWLTTTLLTDEKRKPVAIATTERDITERKKAEKEILLRVSQLATARAIGQTLVEILELDQIYERLYQATINMLSDSDTVFISLFDREKAEFRCVFAMSESERIDASKLPPAPLEPPGKGTQSEVVHTRLPLIVGDLQARLKKVKVVVDISKTGEKVQSGLYVPMLAKGEVIGVVITQSRKLNRYTQDDAEMLSLVANTAAIAIQNAQLFTQTEQRLQQQARFPHPGPPIH
jgi:PAS domain S-box-containing protein